jgi:energy-coupling factor transport system substrate-specific component
MTQENITNSSTKKGQQLAFIALAAGMNVGIGFLVQVLKLPVFLDSIGTILTTLIIGWRAGAIAGVLGFVITSIIIFPPAIFFSGTQIIIALTTHFLAKAGGFKNAIRTVVSGIVVAFAAALVSAPIIYYLFGGVTGNGIGIFTVYLEAIGFSKVYAVIISGLSAELIDKTSQCLIALFILKSIPSKLLKPYGGKFLEKNNFVK